MYITWKETSLWQTKYQFRPPMLRSKSTLAWGSLQRAVSNVKFYQNLSSSIGDVGGRNLPSCISLATGLYNCFYYLLYSHDKHSVQERQTSQTWCMFNFRPDASSCLHTWFPLITQHRMLSRHVCPPVTLYQHHQAVNDRWFSCQPNILLTFQHVMLDWDAKYRWDS